MLILQYKTSQAIGKTPLLQTRSFQFNCSRTPWFSSEALCFAVMQWRYAHHEKRKPCCCCSCNCSFRISHATKQPQPLLQFSCSITQMQSMENANPVVRCLHGTCKERTTGFALNNWVCSMERLCFFFFEENKHLMVQFHGGTRGTHNF